MNQRVALKDESKMDAWRKVPQEGTSNEDFSTSE